MSRIMYDYNRTVKGKLGGAHWTFPPFQDGTTLRRSDTTVPPSASIHASARINPVAPEQVKKHEKQEPLKAIDVISAARTQQEKAMENYLLLTADKGKIKIPGIGESWKGVPQEIQTIKGDIPMSSLEKEELDKGDTASDVYLAAGVASAVGDVVGVILDFAVKAQPMGVGADTSMGGSHLSRIHQFYAEAFRTAAQHTSEGGAQTG
ncbi:hypothetical protein BDV36DRAFT_300966 [Aspergillus pseudocaelatus]|uniref:Uncharacterized protein n=1 Tax=Aspergillus pseudocaelatus TaxID=1825620 RepID=A0ABQ6W5Q2_9EURO|nr:hypothetical protein BDV36DRAFT_300966 [Aspergillus pseudocaelatus]